MVEATANMDNADVDADASNGSGAPMGSDGGQPALAWGERFTAIDQVMRDQINAPSPPLSEGSMPTMDFETNHECKHGSRFERRNY